MKSPKLKVRTYGDTEGKTKTLNIEGQCKKCGTGNNVLVLMGFDSNPSNNSLSVMKTKCLVCLDEDFYFIKDAKMVKEPFQQEFGLAPGASPVKPCSHS